MGHKRLFLLVCFCSLFNYATVFNTEVFAFVPAQGDGDPVEVSALDLIQAEQKLADEENSQTATITAEGDFLLPTYLVNSTQEDIPVEEKTKDQSSLLKTPQTGEPTKKLVNISRKTETDLPVVMIKQTELVPVREQMEVEKRLTGSTAQTQQIYDQITQRKPRANSAVSSSKNSNTLASALDDDISDILAGTHNKYQNTDTATDKKKKPLLLPLKGTKKTSNKTVDDEFIAQPKLKTYSSIFADKVLEAAQTGQDLPLIMPMDLKVSFYPNAADFSGQTIKWLKAFSYRALQDPRYVIEVRLSKDDLILQQKRLFVIQKILANEGLSSHQLVIDYVNRPKDSLILRMVKKEPSAGARSRSKKEKGVINW